MKIEGRRFLITGGTGFVGAALARRLVASGGIVRVFDDNSRGAIRRLAEVLDRIEVVEGDVRDARAVCAALDNIDCVWHLAYVNGTRFFYERPEFVLEVGVKGIINVIEGCREKGVRELILASSSEVYQTPPVVPTDESAPMSIPEPLNPRYSYAGGKIISELLSINFGRKEFDRVVIFRLHNVYGCDMGWEHVIPELIVKLRDAIDATPQSESVQLEIQGTGQQTRAFVHIDDVSDALVILYERGTHLGIYHVGNDEEVEIAELARKIGQCFGRSVTIKPGPPATGGTPRRCPNITKMRALGYEPSRPLAEGLPPVVEWYKRNLHFAPVQQS